MIQLARGAMISLHWINFCLLIDLRMKVSIEISIKNDQYHFFALF